MRVTIETKDKAFMDISIVLDNKTYFIVEQRASS